MSKQHTTPDPVDRLGALLRDLDALTARYAAKREALPPERRACVGQMLTQAYYQVKLAADELALAYKGTV